MLKFDKEQRTLIAEKVAAAGNLAAGALIFGQVITDMRFSVGVALLGLGIWTVLLGYAVLLRKRR